MLRARKTADPSKPSPLLGEGSNDGLQEGPSPQDNTETPAIKKEMNMRTIGPEKQRAPIFENSLSDHHDNLGTYKGIALDHSGTHDWQYCQKVSSCVI
ncbi:Uncharacterized protein HZ326_13655 [Fusarium oxysporum f. sp. albedinis]|nr:Uncharacterized protein HZ326_13655 [Fusarium oxysporum f. sp. albedinis]